ncbi:mannonate oxidoreductase, partial [Clostridium botulinum]|nr:mannonate oxidoreductase [Clostridium botulinum]
KYMDTKSYNYNLIEDSKIIKNKELQAEEDFYEYSVGDKVILLENNESAIVYKERDRLNNVTILYNKEFIDVNYKRIKLELKASELYPEGYDLNQLFISYKERKLEKDIKRGSKKALKRIKKETLKRSK